MEPNIYRIAMLKALSVASMRDLRRWLADGSAVELPYTWDGGAKVFECNEEVEVVEDSEFSTYLRIDADSEAVIYLDGVPHHIYMRRLEEIPLRPGFRKLSIEFLGRDVDGLGARVRRPSFYRARLLTRSKTVLGLATLLEALVELWRMSSDSSLRREIEEVVSRALSMVYTESLDPGRLELVASYVRDYDYFQWYTLRRVFDEIPRSVLVAAGCREPNLREVIGRAREALRYVEQELMILADRYGKRGFLHAVATTHLDFLWLWGRDVFERKLGGSTATLLLYLERFPSTVVGITSTHYVDEVAKLYPELFEKLRRCFGEGRCISIGGFWTEFDANLIDGESLARQFLYGQRILKKLVGVEARVSFLPDTFGFPPSLPQVLLKSGIELFIVRKLNWNEVNRFPYKHFLWIGIDGSAIPTLFVDHYAASLPIDLEAVFMISRGVERYIDRMAFPYGYGDGGGGPSEESILRLEAYSKLPTAPIVVHGEIEKLVEAMERARSRLPMWLGELYLENHRGVYSAGLRLKSLIWSCVKLLKTIDALLALAALHGVDTGIHRDEVIDLWLRALSYQFHDVFASTLSYDGYIDALKELGKVYARALDTARRILYRIAKAKNLRDGVAIFNPHPWSYRALIEIEAPPDSNCAKLEDRALPCQVIEDLGDRKKLLIEIELPPLGIAVLEPTKLENDAHSGSGVYAECDASRCILENEHLRVVVDRSSGFIESIVDKELGIEVLRERSNVIELCEDRPRHWEGWNIDADYRENCIAVDKAESVEISICGFLRSCIRVVKRFRSSEIVQDICLDRASRIVLFITEILWFERQHLLKAWFYPDVVSHEAWFETSFGAFPRPLHRNTSWEQAKFETWMSRWVDISEKRFGVALISLHSRSVTADLRGIGLTLLRSPVSPVPHDIGRNRIVYALYIHRGDWRDSRIQHLVREIDEKPLVIKLSRGAASGNSILRGLEIAGDALVEGVKLCEDFDNCILLRVFDAYGARSTIDLTHIPNTEKCLETNITETQHKEASCKTTLRPFEIKSIAIKLHS